MKIEKIIDELRKGYYEKMGDLVIGRLKNGRLVVLGYLPYNTISEIPIAELPNELQKVKTKFGELLEQSPSVFKEFVMNCAGIDYEVVLDTGMGGVCICKEEEGEFRICI